MIASLTGTIRAKSPELTIVETGGVGYAVCLPLSTYCKLPEKEKEVSLLIYTHIREDAFNLFGFLTNDEKTLFEKLISISGIGPRLAINILSGISVGDLIHAIGEGNLTTITSVPGVGKKMGQRIVLELKDKIGAIMFPGTKEDGEHAPAQAERDAVAALVSLGYKINIAGAAVQKAKKMTAPKSSLEDLIKDSLKVITTR